MRVMVLTEGVIDSENGVGELVSYLLSRGWMVTTVGDISEAELRVSSEHYDLGIIPATVFQRGHWAQTEALIRANRVMRWLGLITEGDLRNRDARRWISEHLYDYYVTPVDAAAFQREVGEIRLPKDPDQGAVRLDRARPEIVGNSVCMRKLFRTIEQFAPIEAPVLIIGESGTGKELVARAIHGQSMRAGKPYVAVNCGALTPTLVQSEMFGHAKGAFTGATKQHIGRIEVADGGTILLDEIGDLPLEQQVNLLRFLEEGAFERVGSTKSIEADVRVIAATHVGLVEAVEHRRFRADLYYRLNVLHVHVPPLREREGDVELLAEYALEKFSHQGRGGTKRFSDSALSVMRQYHWPGNVRELINTVRRAMAIAEGPVITPRELGLERREQCRSVLTLEEARSRAERAALLACLRGNKRNVSEAARQLGVSRPTLYRLMRDHGIKLASAQSDPDGPSAARGG